MQVWVEHCWTLVFCVMQVWVEHCWTLVFCVMQVWVEHCWTLVFCVMQVWVEHCWTLVLIQVWSFCVWFKCGLFGVWFNCCLFGVWFKCGLFCVWFKCGPSVVEWALWLSTSYQTFLCESGKLHLLDRSFCVTQVLHDVVERHFLMYCAQKHFDCFVLSLAL